MCFLGQASIARLGRSLNSLVKEHGICVLLLNAVVSVGQTDAGRAPAEEQMVMGKPALGKRYAEVVDLSIYVSSNASASRSSEDEENVRTFEIIEDHGGHREGKWCQFQTDGISLYPCSKPAWHEPSQAGDQCSNF